MEVQRPARWAGEGGLVMHDREVEHMTGGLVGSDQPSRLSVLTEATQEVCCLRMCLRIDGPGWVVHAERKIT